MVITKLEFFNIAENTNNLLKNPIKGGTPAIESKSAEKQTAAK
jgi:hypothetical protein